jgi:hypothetical protein
MNSPPSRVHTSGLTATVTADAFSAALSSGLEKAAQFRDEATPSPVYKQNHFEQPFRYLAQLNRNHFKPAEAERLRRMITDYNYWQREVGVYEIAIQSLKENFLVLEEWRNLAKACKNLLKRGGMPQRQIQELRLSIDDAAYWEVEANFFKMQSSRREAKVVERLRGSLERRPGSSSRHHTPRVKRTQSTEPVSSRTRSKDLGRVRKRRLRSGNQLAKRP